MALFKDFLTRKGTRMLSGMLTGEIENLRVTRVTLGDGDIKNPEEATEMISPICEAAIESVTLNDNNMLSITASFDNAEMENGFYMKEKGVYISDGKEEILAIYANAGSTASYIEPAASGLIKKVIRSSIAFSQSDNVNVTLKDSGYANAVDFENHIKNKENPHGVTAEQVGLGNVPNVATNDQKVTYDISEQEAPLTPGESLKTAFGKLAKAVAGYIEHKADKIVHVTAEERQSWNNKVDKQDGKGLSTNDFSNTYKTKLDGIATGANNYTLPTASASVLGGVKTGSNLTNSGGTISLTKANVTAALGYTPPTTNTTYSAATPSANGLMSSADKTKLDGIATGATRVTITKNLAATSEGTALDAIMGKQLYDYIKAMQAEVYYLKAIAGRNERFTAAKYATNFVPSEFGNGVANCAYMPYSVFSKLTSANRIIIYFSNGAIGVFKAGNTCVLIDSWVTITTVPFVSQSLVKNGTNVLATTSVNGGGYTRWDEDIYTSTGQVIQTAVLEIVPAKMEMTTCYMII